MKAWKSIAWLLLGTMLSTGAWTQSSKSERVQSPEEAFQLLQQEAPGVRIYGPIQQLSRIWGVPLAFGASPTETALGFLARYSAIFNPGDTEFMLGGTQELMNGKFTAVYFSQTLNGVPVDRGYLTLMVRNAPDYPLVLVVSNVKPIQNVNLQPVLKSERAISIARQFKSGLKEFSTPELTTYLLEAETRLAWSFFGDNQNLEQPERYQIFVDANTGEILEWRDKVYYTDVTGHVNAWFTPGLLPDQSNNPEVLGPLPQVRARISGGNSIFADLNGDFTIPHGGTAPVTVITEMFSPHGRVTVASGGGTNLTAQQSVTPPGPANFELNAGRAEFDTAQVNGLIHTQIAHDFVKSINSGYPGIDIQIPCTVNIGNTCNAYYSANTINFYRAGGGCPNTAYSTVIYHEYGHFVIDEGYQANPPASPTGDYHEGMADVIAALLTNNSCLGQDFRGQGTGCLRSADNNIQHPCNGEVHDCGRVLSGAFWHTLDAMKARYPGDQQFALDTVRSWAINSILLVPADIGPEITVDLISLDDDDGNLNNGSPHYAQINEGFSRHNMPAPPIDWVNITPIRLPSAMVAPNSNVVFKVSITDGPGQVDPNNVALFYSVNGGAYQRVPMAQLANPNRYRVKIIGGFPCSTSVRYYIEAGDTQGRITRFPRTAPTEANSFLVGTGTTVTMQDTFETDMGWTVQNVNLSTGAWTRANPNGTYNGSQPSNPENDSDDPGSLCYFTGQGTPGGAIGEQDVDGGPTNLTSPAINLAGSNAIIEYSRWFYNGVQSSQLDDSLVVEVSNDNGTTWRTVETVRFTGTENQWVRRSFIVSDYVAPTAQVRVRFRTADGGTGSIVEAGVDNFVVNQVSCN